MKIIAIGGGAGAGKTTVANFLAENLPNSAVIDGDYFMHIIDAEKHEEIINAIGVEELIDDIYEFNYYFQSANSISAWINMIKEKVNEYIEDEIIRYKNKDYVIIDWAFIPKCDVYKKCDVKINVNTDLSIAEKRLIKRLKKYDKKDVKSYWAFEKWAIANRAKYTRLEEHGKKANFQIVNNDNILKLENEVKKISKKIISK